MKKILSITFLLLLCYTSTLFAQDRPIRKLSKHKRHKIAHDLIKRGSYYNAIDQMTELTKTYPEEKEFVFRLAQAYFASRDYVNAELWFKKSIDLEGKEVGLTLFYYGETLKYNAKYEDAKKAFNDFLSSKFKEAKNDKFRAIAKNEVASCDYALAELNNLAYADIKHLGDNVNCGYSDFSPFKKGDTLYFASMQSDSVLSHQHEEIHFKHVKLFTSENKGGEWSVPTALEPLNAKFENTANGVFSVDKKKFYYTKCKTDDSHKMNCQIYVSKYENGVFQEGEKLTGFINAEGVTYTQPHPFILGSGKSATEALMFVSDITGGKGGLDIWYSTPDKNGAWKKPTNLGSTINTIRDEITPYYDAASSTLYFSSNYHYGFGGFDIFKSKGLTTKWEKPSNLGLPINSRVDDTYFSFNSKQENGFLVSNRPGGTHLLSETCCDDIYDYQYKPISLVAVRIFDKNTKTRMEGVDMSMLVKQEDGSTVNRLSDSDSSLIKRILYDTLKTTRNKNPLELSTVDVQTLYKVANNKEYTLKPSNTDSMTIVISTSEIGKFKILKSLPDSLAKIEIKQSNQVDIMYVDLYMKPGSTTKTFAKEEPKPSNLVDVSEYTISKVFKNGDLSDKDAVIDLKVILNFALGDTEFLEGKEASLDSLVLLLKNYPDLKIEISAHTDNIGEHEFNIDLSNKRAATIEKYLAGKGVVKTRMKSKGFGETQPLMPNENPDGSDNPEARALNRRAEIKILRNLKTKSATPANKGGKKK